MTAVVYEWLLICVTQNDPLLGYCSFLNKADIFTDNSPCKCVWWDYIRIYKSPYSTPVPIRANRVRKPLWHAKLVVIPPRIFAPYHFVITRSRHWNAFHVIYTLRRKSDHRCVPSQRGQWCIVWYILVYWHEQTIKPRVELPMSWNAIVIHVGYLQAIPQPWYLASHTLLHPNARYIKTIIYKKYYCYISGFLTCAWEIHATAEWIFYSIDWLHGWHWPMQLYCHCSVEHG